MVVCIPFFLFCCSTTLLWEDFEDGDAKSVCLVCPDAVRMVGWVLLSETPSLCQGKSLIICLSVVL